MFSGVFTSEKPPYSPPGTGFELSLFFIKIGRSGVDSHHTTSGVIGPGAHLLMSYTSIAQAGFEPATFAL